MNPYKVMHLVTIAEDSGHKITIVLRDGQILEGCYVLLTNEKEKFIRVTRKVAGKSVRTKLSIGEIADVCKIKEQAA